MGREKRKDIILDTTPDSMILDLEESSNIGRKKSNTKAITMALDIDKLNELQKMARLISVKENKNILYTDLIKMAIDKEYFEGKKSNSQLPPP